MYGNNIEATIMYICFNIFYFFVGEKALWRKDGEEGELISDIKEEAPESDDTDQGNQSDPDTVLAVVVVVKKKKLNAGQKQKWPKSQSLPKKFLNVPENKQHFHLGIKLMRCCTETRAEQARAEHKIQAGIMLKVAQAHQILMKT